MDFHHHNNNHRSNHHSSPSSSNSSSTTTVTTPHPPSDDPMQSWWESVSKARSRIHALAAILPSSSADALSALADSDRPALSLLSSPAAYSAVFSSLQGSASDPLCHWLYDTFLSSDPHLRLLVLSFLPLLSALYLSRIHHHSDPPSLAGVEAVLLAIYAVETKSRAGKPLLVTIPDLSQPSIYHAPLRKPSGGERPPSVGVLSPPLEPHVAMKSTKRATIVGTALHCYYAQISQMPSWSKLEFCRFAAGWAGQECPCRRELDLRGNHNGVANGHSEIGDGNGELEIEEVVEDMGNMQIQKCDFDVDSDSRVRVEGEEAKGDKIPLPWEILQPVLRILGHCLLGPLNTQDVKDAASFAVRCLYARANHDLVPQAILATRSLIQLDNRAREAAKAAAAAATAMATAAAATANSSSNVNTPTKSKKPEILLVSK